MQFAQPIHEWTSKQTNKQNKQKTNKQAKTNKHQQKEFNKKTSPIYFNFDVGVLRSWWQLDVVMSVELLKSNSKQAGYNIKYLVSNVNVRVEAPCKTTSIQAQSCNVADNYS